MSNDKTTPTYEWVPDWGDVSEEDADTLCVAAEIFCDDDARASVTVRAPRDGEARGLYHAQDGRLQILGHTVPVPDSIQELTDEAWDHAWGVLGKEEQAPTTVEKWRKAAQAAHELGKAAEALASAIGERGVDARAVSTAEELCEALDTLDDGLMELTDEMRKVLP